MPWGAIGSGSNDGSTSGTSVPVTSARAPQASFTVSATTGNWPLTITFTDTSTHATNLDKAIWSMGDGTTRPWTAGEVFTHVYQSAGSFTASLSLKNDIGGSTANQVITPTNAADPVPTFTSTQTAFVQNVSQTMQFVLSCTGGPVSSATFEYGDGIAVPVTITSGGASVTLTHTYLAVGTYTAKFTVNGPQDSVDYSATVIFYGPPQPDFSVSVAPDPINGTLVTVTSTTAGDVTSAVFNFGDGTPSVSLSAGQSVTHQYGLNLAGTTQTLQLTATGPGGTEVKTKTVSIPLTINPVITLSYVATSGPSPLGGATIDATVTLVGAAISAQLDFGNGTIVQLPIPTDPYSTTPISVTRSTTYPANTNASPDTYNIVASCVAPSGTIQDTKQITIPGIPAPTAEYSFVPGSTQSNGLTPFTFSFTPSGTITSYSFNPGFGTPLVTGVASGDLVINYPSSGTYNTSYTVTGPGGTNTKSLSFTINAATPIADFQLSAANATPTSPTSTVSVTLTNTSNLINATTATYSLSWGDGQTQTLGNAFAPISHTYPAVPSGNKTVALTITTAGGTNTFSRTFAVNKIAPQVTSTLVEGTYNNPGGLPVTVNISNNSSEIATQTIDWGDGTSVENVLGQTSVSHTYAATLYGLKTITLTSINTAGQDIDTFTVTKLPTGPVQPPVSNLIDFKVINGSQYAVTNEPVSVSIPLLATDGFLNTSTFSVCDTSNNPIAAQFKVLSRHGALREDATAPIKLVQATFLATVGASGPEGIGAQSSYKLATNATSPPVGTMEITEDANKFLIKPGGTGNPWFEVSKTKFTIMNGAWMNNGAQQIFANCAAATGLSYRSKSGSKAAGFATITPPTGVAVETVLEEGVVSTGQIKVVVRQTLSLTQGAQIVCRWTFVHGNPEAQIDFTLRNRNRFHDNSASDGPASENNQWSSLNYLPAHVEKYAEFVQYLTLGCQLPTGFSTIRVGKFNSAASDWRSRTVSYSTLSATQVYRLQQYFRDYKHRRYGSAWDIAAFNSGDPDPGNLAYYKEGVTTSYTTYEGRPNGTENITSYSGTGPLQPTGFASDPESGRYPGGWVIDNGSNVGCIITADTFWERAPKRFEVDKDNRTVKFHIFPEALPSDTSFFDRGNRIGRYADGTIYPQYLKPPATTTLSTYVYPSGTNPMTGLAYQTGDYVPPTFPDRGTVIPAETKPVSNGTVNGELSPNGGWQWSFVSGTTGGFWRPRANAQPATSGYPDADTAYTVYGGSWVLQRLRVRLFNTAQTETNIKQRMDLTINPMIGLTAPSKYREAVALTPMPWYEPGTAGESWDVDRAERFLKAIVDTASADGAASRSVSGNFYYGTLKYLMNFGSKVPGINSNNVAIRPIGWDNWGDIWGGENNGWTNLSYDIPRWVLIEFVRTLDYRFFSLSKRLHEWQLTRGFIKSAAANYYASGLPYWEQGLGGHGFGKEPLSSHAWLGGQCLAYALTGNEHYTDSLLYCIPALGGRYDRNPTTWPANTVGERVWAHSMHDLMFMYTVLGPLNARTVASKIFSPTYATIPTDYNTDDKSLLQLIRDGFQNYDDIQAGVKLVRRAKGFCPTTYTYCMAPANFVPTSVTSAIGGITVTYLSGPADPSVTSVSGAKTLTGYTSNSSSTFSLTGRDYSNNGFVFYYNESNSAAFYVKSFMFLYCLEAMHMLAIVDPNGPKTARAKTLLRRGLNFWYGQFVSPSVVGGLNNTVYVGGTSDRALAVKTSRPSSATGYTEATMWGNNWLAEAPNYIPNTGDAKGMAFNNLDSVYLNVVAASMGVLAFANDTQYSTATERTADKNQFISAFRTAVRYCNSQYDTTGRLVGYSKSALTTESPYNANGTPRKLYANTATYELASRSDLSAVVPVDYHNAAAENATKSMGQSIFRGLIYGQAAAKIAGITGEI